MFGTQTRSELRGKEKRYPPPTETEPQFWNRLDHSKLLNWLSCPGPATFNYVCHIITDVPSQPRLAV